jgi:hypothetical protein
LTYKDKLISLLSLISVLSLLYIASFIFNHDRNFARSSSYVWLDQKFTDGIKRITVNSLEHKFEFLRKSDQWFILYNEKEYPARQLRIEDFVSIFTSRAAWTIRSSNSSSHSRFGLNPAEAARLTIYGENTVLLDLLLSFPDSPGAQIFIRKFGENEVRSGENNITSYLTGPVNNWFNLRLFAESENGKIDVDSVQRLSVSDNGEIKVFSRMNRSWTVSGIEISNPDQSGIERYIRNVLNSEGDNFIDADSLRDVDFNNSIIVMEFNNGKIATVRFSEPDENSLRYAKSSASEYIYSVPLWVSSRLFTASQNFEMQ